MQVCCADSKFVPAGEYEPVERVPMKCARTRVRLFSVDVASLSRFSCTCPSTITTIQMSKFACIYSRLQDDKLYARSWKSGRRLHSTKACRLITACFAGTGRCARDYIRIAP
jgi:hypothetical protein